MTLKTLGYALVAGITAFLVVGVTVTELAAAWVEFSLFVGIPTGVVAGAAVAAVVAFGLRTDVDQRQHRFASVIAGFGLGFLAALVVLSGLIGLGVVLSMGLGVVIGLVSAVASYLHEPTGPGEKPLRSEPN